MRLRTQDVTRVCQPRARRADAEQQPCSSRQSSVSLMLSCALFVSRQVPFRYVRDGIHWATMASNMPP
eukprot:7363796-Pyramimonas_sp.AAC.1